MVVANSRLVNEWLKLSLVSASLIVLACTVLLVSHAHSLPAHVRINHIAVGGLSVGQAHQRLHASLTDRIQIRVIDQHGQHIDTLVLPTAEIGVHYPRTVVESKLRHLMEPLFKLERGLTPQPAEIRMEVPVAYDATLLQNWAMLASKQANRQPVNAYLDFEGSLPVLVPHQYGLQLDPDRISAAVTTALERGDFLTIEVVGTQLRPIVTTEHLPDFSRELYAFSTPLTRDKNRNHNIHLANESVTGYILEPGQIFSFLDTVGHATAERGFMPAPTIAQQQLSLNHGGGICQVSSNIYQAALHTGLSIVRRRNHSVPVEYLPLGYDAAVSYPALDLQIENPFDYPVMLIAWLEEEHSHVAIYGPAIHPHYDISIIVRDVQVLLPTTRTILDDTLPEGTRTVEHPGRNGYKLRVYRRVEGLDQTWEELLSVDTYVASPKVVRIGAKVANSTSSK